MHPEDRLDALLTALRRSERGERDDARDSSGGWTPTGVARTYAQDAELAPLMDAAARLEPLWTAQPDARFAQALQARILAKASERRRDMLAPVPASTARSEEAGRRVPPALAHGRALLRPALVAAVALIALSIGTLTAAAHAGPGNPLFLLHRLEQSVQVAAAGDNSDRARLHMQYARQWLAAVHDAAATHAGDPTYSSALQALRDEDTAAAQDIAQVPAGSDRDALNAELASLHGDERNTLRDALAGIGWPDRVSTTSALGALGVTVPRVVNAKAVVEDGSWNISIEGSGFQPGAVLLVNGQPVGSAISSNDNELEARLPVDAFPGAPQSLGVGNPDGTAASTTNIHLPGRPGAGATGTPHEHDGNGTPEPNNGDHNPQGTATPTGDHEGKSTPGPTPTYSGEGGGAPTPTP